MMPTAEMPFNEKQWLSKLDPPQGSISFKVISEQSEIVGHFAFLRVKNDLREAALGMIYLTPMLRHTGAPHRLMELAEQRARDLLDLKSVILNV